MPRAKYVTITEVGPRDGLQNEPKPIPSETKIELINQLSQTGLSVIETTSFVRAQKIPQLADAQTVQAGITQHPRVRYPVLIPNLHGLDDALQCDVQAISLFSGVSESFVNKNINCSIDESLERADAVIKKAKQHQLKIRAYLSCTLGCPYEGAIAPEKTLDLALRFLEMGASEISVADTIGVATPKQVQALLDTLTAKIPAEKLAVHFHDTYGQALANLYTALEHGISIIDSSIAGLGGCPYAKGASGNVATEDVVYMLNGLGIKHGINLDKLVHVSHFISAALDRPNGSKVAKAWPPVTNMYS